MTEERYPCDHCQPYIVTDGKIIWLDTDGTLISLRVEPDGTPNKTASRLDDHDRAWLDKVQQVLAEHPKSKHLTTH